MNKRTLFPLTFWLLIGTAFFLAYQEQRFSRHLLSDSDVDINSVLNFDKKELKVTALNNSHKAVEDVTLEILANGNLLRKENLGTIGAGQTTTFTYFLSDETANQKNPLTTRAGYSISHDSSGTERLGTVTLNEWPGLSEPNQIAATCPNEVGFSHSHHQLRVDHPENASVNLILPEGLEITSLTKTAHGSDFVLQNLNPYRNSNFTAFLTVQPHFSSPSIRTLTCPIKMTAAGIPRSKSSLGITSTEIFGISLLGLLTAVIAYRLSCRTGDLAPWSIAIIRWAFTIFVVCIATTLYSATPQASAIINWYLGGLRETLQAGASPLIDGLMRGVSFFEFRGKDYEYFNEFCLHPLLLYILGLNLFVLRFLIKPNPFEDKYWHLFLRCAASFPTTDRFTCSQSPAPDSADTALAHTALLSIFVKIFFLPVFLSWTIGNIYHTDYLLRQNEWNFFEANKFVVGLFLLVDVAVFTFGYFVELPQLKNQIKSVEPTVLGWILCIMCYPPFNTWVFQGIDTPLTSSWTGVDETTSKLVLFFISALWTIYLWATIALGFKASNLTNRGIIASGPYRYVRHPAYISKLLLWTITGMFLAQLNFFLVIAFWVVYWGRAVTEERHLSRDADYVAYKEAVPWRFIPGLY